MKKIFSLISFLLILTFSITSPLYAVAHEKKEVGSTNVVSTETAVDVPDKNNAINTNVEASEQNKADDDEEPDCD